MAVMRKGIGAAVAALALGAALLAGCGEGDAQPEAPGELIHQRTRAEEPTGARVEEALGVSSACAVDGADDRQRPYDEREAVPDGAPEAAPDAGRAGDRMGGHWEPCASDDGPWSGAEAPPAAPLRRA